MKDLGGPDIAGVGFALGVERLAIVLGGETAAVVPEFVIAPLGAGAEIAAARLAHRLRRAGVRVEVEPGERSLKSQMRHAGKLGARYVVLLGEDELASGRVTVRDMAERRDLRQVAALEGSAEELRAALRSQADAGTGMVTQA